MSAADHDPRSRSNITTTRRQRARVGVWLAWWLLAGLLTSGRSMAQSPGEDAEAAAWPVIGRQGIIRIVIVPMSQARDRDAYARQVARLCESGQTCFLNFFTNSTAAPLEVPLPDAIAHEATAIYRLSMKQGAELFRFSCRLGVSEGDCF